MQWPTPAIELRHLRYFLAVADELHFGHAAERLHVAQPGLSQAILKLEDELGVRLFNRTSRVVTLTEAGRTLTAHAQEVLTGFNLAVSEARRAGGSSDVLRVGYVPYMPLRSLQTFLEALDGAEPAVRPEVSHLGTADQLERLHNAELDIGIFRDLGDSSRLEMHPLFAGEPLGALVARTSPLAKLRVVGPGDLRAETLLSPSGTAVPNVLVRSFLRILEDAGLEFAAVHELNSQHPADYLLAAAGGLGVVIAPASMASGSEAGSLLTWVPLTPPVLMPDTVVAWRANPPPRLGATLASVREIARRLRSESPSGGLAPPAD
jgi:DNA-binding transcriptional LysR family regulator